MKSILSGNHRFLFYMLWLLLSVFQAALTELQDDEAYYWVSSKYPALGYFDHPPITAMLIRAGYAIFPNELGVRLIAILLSLLTLLLIEKLLPKKNILLFYIIALSLAFLQLGGFLAVPDTPLLFFTTLFFYCWKKFLENSSLKHSLFLAVAGVLLFYTKYHAVLIIFFTLLSYPSVLKKRGVYLSALFGLLLILPHLYWQWSHDWVSFRYHLFESNVDPYRPAFTIAYIGGQFLMAGPVAGIILLPAAILYKPQSVFERSLKWTLAGIYIFFLASSLRGEVEINWTVPALVPLFILSHQYLLQKPKLFLWLYRLLPLSILIIALARVAMIADILPVKAIQKRFHSWNDWPGEMEKRTNGFPIIFSNSYQRASKYWFYSGQITLSQNHVMDHRNGFDFFPLEKELLGKPVYFLDIYNMARFPDSLKTRVGFIGYKMDSSFACFAGVKIIPGQNSYAINMNDSLRIAVKINIPLGYEHFLIKRPVIKLFIFHKRKIVREISLSPLSLWSGFYNDIIEFNISPGLSPGEYQMEFSLEAAGYNPTHNSKSIGLRIREEASL